MKKKYLAIFTAIILGIMALMSGCKWLKNIELSTPDPWEKKQQEGAFYYYVQNESVTILGLVDSLKVREELVIPETLGGYPVKEIGKYWIPFYGAEERHYGMKCNNIKKIIINHECYLNDYGIKQFDGDIIVNAKVNVVATGYRYHASSEMIDGRYIAANNIQINAEFEKYKNFGCFCWGQANIVKYEAMSGNLKTFYTIVKDGCYIKLPQAPVRDGYNFGGWFKEEECLNEWNFETDVVTEDITLYAKWIEE